MSRSGIEIGRAFEYFLSTGNLISSSGLGFTQASGMAIIADKLNFLRFVSHFRSVHRGAFFTQMRTTSVRKLLPEAWGFLCPVHTPDGIPCGLLNHLSAACKVVCNYDTSAANISEFGKASIVPLIAELRQYLADRHGLCVPEEATVSWPSMGDRPLPVLIDGHFCGWLSQKVAHNAEKALRFMKLTTEMHKSMQNVEITLIFPTKEATLYPGLYIFIGGGRMVRPVRNLCHGTTEWIGAFEQVYLSICVTKDEFIEGTTTHQELSPDSILSFVALLTPFSDHNQSPRNVYQCQMGKQTMGTPCHSIPLRTDNKLYRLQTPQSAMVCTKAYDKFEIDNYPLGTNACVAVISYTGYDMEDAMIISRASHNRGFAHGCIYKTERVDLRKVGGNSRKGSRTSDFVFGRDAKKKELEKYLDFDGLPYIGVFLSEGDPMYSTIETHTGIYNTTKYKSSEGAYVDRVTICGSGDDVNIQGIFHVCILLRIPRNPIVGDKFASRHGQKGICSFLWPAENLPFTESGLFPDIIFNPHGFPSRMTVGMMIESMAGKASASHGLKRLDASPFLYGEDVPAVDYFGRMLEKAGYNYYGSERMYSGIDGRELEVEIFFGVVYYQRLRHMVSDKYQVRTTGPVDNLTHQPVHGRKRGGGIRFGEMERDSLLAHGTAFLLQDRLFNNSDREPAYICTKCGQLLTVAFTKLEGSFTGTDDIYDSKRRWRCSYCQNSSASVKLIQLPYVFRYLANELAAMNIKVQLNVTDE